MGKIRSDVSELHKKLLDKASSCLTYKNIFIIDDNNLVKNNDHSGNSELGIIQYWIIFSTGIELLLKSVLLKHKCLKINKKIIMKKTESLNKSAKNYSDSLNVYQFIDSFQVYATTNTDIQKQLTKKRITRLYEIDLGTLGTCQNLISKLRSIGIISFEEQGDIFNAIQVLCDVRRNFDVHNVSPLHVQGSINGDLEKLYLPMINLLLKK